MECVCSVQVQVFFKQCCVGNETNDLLLLLPRRTVVVLRAYACTKTQRVQRIMHARRTVTCWPNRAAVDFIRLRLHLRNHCLVERTPSQSINGKFSYIYTTIIEQSRHFFLTCALIYTMLSISILIDVGPWTNPPNICFILSSSYPPKLFRENPSAPSVSREELSYRAGT